MTHQLPLFTFPDDVTGKVWFNGSFWVATIDDWWYATGTSEKDAIKKVVESYEKEKERTMQWNG